MPRSPEAAEPLAIRLAHRIPYVANSIGRLRTFRHRRNSRLAAHITEANTLEAYDRLYGSDQLVAVYLDPARLEFYEEVAARCAALAPRRVIDVGCGTGHLLRSLVDKLGTSPELVVGVDHSPAGIARARALLPTATWLISDLHCIAPEWRDFDLVLCTEVLEHLEEPERALPALRRLCGSSGRVAITVPDGAQDSWEGHVNFWDEAELRAFLGPNGLLGIDRIENDRSFLAWLAPKHERDLE